MQTSATFSTSFSSLGINITANNKPSDIARYVSTSSRLPTEFISKASSPVADVSGATNDTTPPKGIPYCVLGTLTVLDVIVKRNELILSEDLAQTIQRTIEDVHNFICVNNASDKPLGWFDDHLVS